jgi:hypothetical protein
MSPVVQAFASSQLIVFGVNTHVPAEQESVVQTLASLQTFGVPAHAPEEEQTSVKVQALPSVQDVPAALFLVEPVSVHCVEPVEYSQSSPSQP